MGINNVGTGFTNIESLLPKNGLKYGKYWSPYTTTTFENNLKYGDLSDLAEPVRSQIIYSLQYLDFLKIVVDDLMLHSIVQAELYKTYIITAVSIIEAILYHIVKKNFESGNIKKKYLSSIAKIEDEIIVMENKGVIDGDERRMRIAFINELEAPEWYDDVSLCNLIDVTKNSRLGICNSTGYETLHELRHIRNKIHLTIEAKNKTDYHIINEAWYYTARESLYYILTSEKFKVPKPEVYNFIKLTDEEKQEYERIKSTRKI